MSDVRPRIAVFISGRGSGMANLYRASQEKRLSGEIAWVVASKPNARGLEFAGERNIESFVYRVKDYESKQAAADDLLQKLQVRRIDYIALAGYLKLLPSKVVQAYRGRIVNIHPALLPKYGGKGMYGRHVHEAVVASDDKESGATVHLVDEIYDHGRILEQKRVPVHEDDTPESLAERVLKAEHEIYPIALEKLIRGEYETDNR